MTANVNDKRLVFKLMRFDPLHFTTLTIQIVKLVRLLEF